MEDFIFCAVTVNGFKGLSKQWIPLLFLANICFFKVKNRNTLTIKATEQPQRGQKNSSLVSGNWPVEKCFYHSPARTVEFVSEYIFLSSKNKETTKKTKKQKKLKKKRKYLWKIS